MADPQLKSVEADQSAIQHEADPVVQEEIDGVELQTKAEEEKEGLLCLNYREGN